MIGPDPNPRRYARPAAAALLLGLAALAAAPGHAQNDTELWSATLTAAQFTYGGDTYTGYKQQGGGDSTRAGALTKETFSYDNRNVLITFIGRRHSDGALEIHSFEDLRVLGAHWTLHATPAGGTTTQLAFADLQLSGSLAVFELYWRNAGVNWQAADEVALKILVAEKLAGVPEIAGLGVPARLLERLAFALLKENWGDFLEEGQRLVAGIVETVRPRSDELARESHNGALVRVDEARLRSFEWTVAPARQPARSCRTASSSR